MDVCLARYVQLAVSARSVNMHSQTVSAGAREDRMSVPFRRLPSGTILVDVAKTTGAQHRVAVDARMSSHDQCSYLDRQASRLTLRGTDGWWEVDQVVAEVGCGLNRKCPKLAHRHSALSAQGRRIGVVDDGETTDDLVRYIIEVPTSICERLYGRRGARNRAIRA